MRKTTWPSCLSRDWSSHLWNWHFASNIWCRVLIHVLLTRCWSLTLESLTWLSLRWIWWTLWLLTLSLILRLNLNWRLCLIIITIVSIKANITFILESWWKNSSTWGLRWCQLLLLLWQLVYIHLIKLLLRLLDLLILIIHSTWVLESWWLIHLFLNWRSHCLLLWWLCGLLRWETWTFLGLAHHGLRLLLTHSSHLLLGLHRRLLDALVGLHMSTSHLHLLILLWHLLLMLNTRGSYL